MYQTFWRPKQSTHQKEGVYIQSTKVAAYIQEHYNKKLTIEQLAKEANLSRTHFQHLFKDIYKVTPIQYQLQLRISTAKQLLVGTTFSCKEIAQMIGFENVYYFSKKFSQIEKVPPSAYRKKYLII